MKLLLLSIIPVLSTFLGYKLSKIIKDRLNYTKDFLNYLNHLKLNITYQRKELSIINDTFYKKDKTFTKILNNYNEYLSSLNKDTFFDNLKECLQNKDLNEIYSFLIGIGECDYLNQINIIDKEIKLTEVKIDELNKDDKLKGSLFIKLGLIIGIALMVLLV